MKKNSINRGIILSFLCILLLSPAVFGAANYHEAYRSAVEQSEKYVGFCANNVTNLLHHHWGGLDALEREPEGKLYHSARLALRNLCTLYQLNHLYIYTVDPGIPARHAVICAADDPEEDKRMQDTFTLQARPADALTEGEQALLAGETNLQAERRLRLFGSDTTWLAPLYDADGKLCAILGIDDSRQLEDDIRHNFLADIIPFSMALGLGLLVLLVLVRRRIVIPIGEISGRMKLFARDSRKKPEPLNIHSYDEIGEIASSFEKMTEDISAYVNSIEKLTQEKAETQTQLALARRIQYGLVPERTDIAGDGWRISAMTRPAKAVGGDFYDCFQRADGGVCVVMGDVSGKGVSAAISMAMIRAVIREKLKAGLGPAETLNQTNDQLCAQNPENQFFTAFAAVLNPATGELRYANAGHTPPVLLKKEPAFLVPDSGIVLGIFEDADLKEAALTLAPEEGILLYTDGVTEAVSPERTFFGEKRLLEAVRGFSGREAPVETVLRVSRAVGSFCGNCEPFDDMAVLALVRRPSSEADGESGLRAPASAVWRGLPVSLEAFNEIRAAVSALAGETPETRRALLACDEALTNIVNYSGARYLSFSCECRDGMLRVAFSDDGVPFDPIAAAVEEREFEMLDNGGMGLSLIRQTASSLSYERKDCRNLFTMFFPVQADKETRSV